MKEKKMVYCVFGLKLSLITSCLYRNGAMSVQYMHILYVCVFEKNDSANVQLHSTIISLCGSANQHTRACECNMQAVNVSSFGAGTELCGTI